ncbi:transcriptional regulator [Nitratireductor aestuarii]|uniref:Transcriptional regulator n=1 Tax=Nitratireductor aestuarii TaxID=1735103 RepID=A0A916W8P3_9HYPH|nr:helix-turn-helix domain-containing protein [Nitratireductor aestuarii]GGA77135.1 transcriptional regulator [Nitratireductor aestuarii]
MARDNQINSLKKGLLVLQVVNQKVGIKASEIAQIARMPRPTVYRILETLEELGFVAQDRSSGLWRVKLHAKSLSSGFRQADWIVQAAVPQMVSLGRRILWPLDLVTFNNDSMVIRESTHDFSPYSVNHGMVGLHLPILDTAGGRAYLSFTSDCERDQILQALETKTGMNPLMTADGPLHEVMAKCRELGVGYRYNGFRAETASLSAVIRHGDRIMACLTLIYFKSAMSLAKAIEMYRDDLLSAVEEIQRSLPRFESELRAADMQSAAEGTPPRPTPLTQSPLVS